MDKFFSKCQCGFRKGYNFLSIYLFIYLFIYLSILFKSLFTIGIDDSQS